MSSAAERSDDERTLALAYRYLNQRERTEAELRRHLQSKHVEAASCERAISTLRALAVIDDARYARLYVQDKRELEQWGAERIRRSLLERGIEREHVDAALSEQDSQTELERAVALLARRLAAPPVDRRERDRALGLLQRKGYDAELALEALAKLGT